MRRTLALVVAVALAASLAACSDDEPAARRPAATTTEAKPPAATTTEAQPPAASTTVAPGPALPHLPVAADVSLDGIKYSLQATRLTFPSYRVVPNSTPPGTAGLAWDLVGSPDGTLSSPADPRSVPPDTEVRVGALLPLPPGDAASVQMEAGGNDAAGGWCVHADAPTALGDDTGSTDWSTFADAAGLSGDLLCGSLFAAAVGRPPATIGPTTGSLAAALSEATAAAFAQQVDPANVRGYVVAVGTGGFSFLTACAVVVLPGSAPSLFNPRGRCAFD